MAATAVGRVDWSMTRDDDGHREYSLVSLVYASDVLDGPGIVMSASGLPAMGSTWAQGNDSDSWAFCIPNRRVTPIISGEPGNWWIVESVFTTKPLRRCQTSSIENPLSEPPDISGSFTSFTREFSFDRFGNALLNGGYEVLRGTAVEFDDGKPTVEISMNLASLPLTSMTAAYNTVNDATLWGMAKRCVKLSRASWARKLYGTCTYYYTVTYGFDISYSTFDHTIPDLANRYLAPGGDPNNPNHYRPTRGLDGEPMPKLLKSNGQPWDGTGAYNTIKIERYNEYNFLLLGIPASL